MTCLTAGLLSIAMGACTNYPFALAPGMGLNAVVAFELVAGRGLTWPQAMTIVFFEGVVITVLVLTRLPRGDAAGGAARPQARDQRRHRPLHRASSASSRRASWSSRPPGRCPSRSGAFQGLPIAVFLIGFVLTAWLMARRVRGALLLGIVLTTILAIVAQRHAGRLEGLPHAGRGPAAGRARAAAGLLDLRRGWTLGVFARLGVLTTILVTFSIMLSDFFDTMGTIIGVGGKGGFLDRAGQLPRANRVLLVDSLGAALGGAGQQQQQHHLHRERGRRGGGRAHRAGRRGDRRPVPRRHVVLAAGQRDPGPGHGAGAHHRRLLHDERGARDRAGTTIEDAIPAFVTMLVMPFTWSITNGIGSGFVTHVAIKVLNGRGGQVHWMLYLAAAAFVVYFLVPLLERLGSDGLTRQRDGSDRDVSGLARATRRAAS